MTPSIFEAIERITVETVEKMAQTVEETNSVLDGVESDLNYKPDVHLSESREIQEAQAKFRELQGWLKEINPKYKPFGPYGANCGSCAFSVWARLTGRNPEAQALAKNIAPEDADMELITGLKVKYMKPEEIEARLRAMGPGAHMICGINRTSGAGHWFNAFFDGKEVKTVDGQVGKIYKWPHDYGRVSEWCALV